MSKITKVHELVEKQAVLYPNKIAIICSDDKITYSRLNEIANQLAHFMVHTGVKPGDLLALFADKKIETLIAILATLKAGATFFLFNPELLEKPVYSILETIQVKHLISQSSLLTHFTNYSGSIINLTNLLETVSAFPKETSPIIEKNDNEYAYGILTSGTTGSPKYVIVTHQNLLDTYYSWSSVYQLLSTDVHLQMATIGFDVFIGDWVRALCSGAQLVLCPKETLLQPKRLYDLIVTHSITCAEFVPATLRGLLNFLEQNRLQLEPFRLMVCGSDQWSMDEYRRVKQCCPSTTRVINSYGLSETTIDSTYFEEVDNTGTVLPSTSLVPVGKPFPHVKIYLLDERGQSVACGAEGEIYIGGSGVASYLGQPQLTMDRFLPDPHQPTQKIYKTGDKGQFLHDGNLYFLGRNQKYIKYDGKKIELLTIEALLNQHQGINHALVIPEITKANKVSLNCFIDINDHTISYSTLREYLRKSLLHIPVHTKFYVVKQISLTANGKVDRRATSQAVIREIKPNLTPPNTALQSELVNLWKEILSVEEIGLHNNFCDLGGSSLLFVQMLEKVNQRYEISLSPALTIKTIKELSDIIQSAPKGVFINPIKQKIINRIAIIGGGPAAVSLCAQLLDQIKNSDIRTPIEIVVFEKNEVIGAGLPYKEKEVSYLLNLPRDQMEASSDKTGEFSAWLKTNYLDDTSFPPRYTFGQYLQYLSKKIQEEAENYGISVDYLTRTTVLNISQLRDGFLIQSSNGDQKADYVVLCTGHMPSEVCREYIGKPGYWHSPWDNEAFSSLECNETVGIIGTRLTAIDIAVRLLNQGHRGQIIMASRSGLLPAVLAKKIPPYPLQHLALDATSGRIKLSVLINLFFKEISVAQGKLCNFSSIVKSYKDITPLEWLRREIDQSEKGLKPWQQVLFSLYPRLPTIWSRMSLLDQKKFLLEYNSTFMTYLAAFPRENADRIQGLLESGQLKILGGLQAIKQQEGKYILQGGNGVAETKYLFNATGPGYNVSRQALYSRMLRQGLICQHPLGGLDVHPQTLQVLTPQRQLNSRLFAVGEPTKGIKLATTDMGSVAEQAHQLSKLLPQLIRRKLAKNVKCDFITRSYHVSRFFPSCSPLVNRGLSRLPLINKYFSRG
jgi:amino acid adenylation domain-containing protein